MAVRLAPEYPVGTRLCRFFSTFEASSTKPAAKKENKKQEAACGNLQLCVCFGTGQAVDYHDSAVASFLDRPWSLTATAVLKTCGTLIAEARRAAGAAPRSLLRALWRLVRISESSNTAGAYGGTPERGFTVNGQISEFENDLCYGKMLPRCNVIFLHIVPRAAASA